MKAGSIIILRHVKLFFCVERVHACMIAKVYSYIIL